jgi:DNA primase
VNCIFHNDKTPSLKLYPAHFHCYGCGKHGDIITLTTQLFTLPPSEAAQKLAQDFHIRRGEKYKDMKPRISEQMKYYEQEQKTFQLLNDYCHFLEKCREDLNPKTPDEDFHPLFIESL